MKLIYLKPAEKSDSVYVSTGTKLCFLRVSVTIEPDRSLLTVRYHELFDFFFLEPLFYKYKILILRGVCTYVYLCTYAHIYVKANMQFTHLSLYLIY